MTKDQLHDTIKVVNKKYGTEELVLLHNVLMKDSAKGWVPAVVYVGPDRFSLTGELKMFCKREEDFLNEFELG